MEKWSIYLSEFQKIKTCFDAKQKCEVRVVHLKVNEWKPVNLLLHKRQVTNISNYFYISYFKIFQDYCSFLFLINLK